MISNILNMIDHQPIHKNNSCIGVAFNFALNYRKLLEPDIVHKFKFLLKLPSKNKFLSIQSFSHFSQRKI
jgi:hypothetical protein